MSAPPHLIAGAVWYYRRPQVQQRMAVVPVPGYLSADASNPTTPIKPWYAVSMYTNYVLCPSNKIRWTTSNNPNSPCLQLLWHCHHAECTRNQQQKWGIQHPSSRTMHGEWKQHPTASSCHHAHGLLSNFQVPQLLFYPLGSSVEVSWMSQASWEVYNRMDWMERSRLGQQSIGAFGAISNVFFVGRAAGAMCLGGWPQQQQLLKN